MSMSPFTDKTSASHFESIQTALIKTHFLSSWWPHTPQMWSLGRPLDLWGSYIFLFRPIAWKEDKVLALFLEDEHFLYVDIIRQGEAPVLWLPDVKSWLTGKDPDTEGRRREWQRMRWLDGITNSNQLAYWIYIYIYIYIYIERERERDMSLSKLQEIVKDREDWCCPWPVVYFNNNQVRPFEGDIQWN